MKKQRNYFVTCYAFVPLFLGCVPLLLNLGACCKSLIRKCSLIELQICKPLVVGSIPTAGTNDYKGLALSAEPFSFPNVAKS